jgi:hypothetical protein
MRMPSAIVTAKCRSQARLVLVCVALQHFGYSQQLNQNCVVAVLNRTVSVNADGSWILPNVPANFGPVRARATCVQNGVTTFGQSALFTVPANGVANLPHVQLGNTTPIPTGISVTAPSTTLNTAGATTQLTVMASYASSPAQNITQSSAGTQYNISNTAIATVSANGLVTAVATGNAVIQAVNEGSQGLIMIQVVLSGVDSDGDGIPDDAEIRIGLNPHDPTDALLDPDHDGLNNLQEYLAGTDIHNPDTDGDGLTDGQEVLIYHTNPLVADTDGDGIPDGLEVQEGTNPLDPNSYNLTAALKSVSITPARFVIAVNTINPNASQQLHVTGLLVDGKTNYDLTSTTKGTTYSSSDLTICNFGSPDGNVFAGNAGNCTITATTNGFTATAQGIVTNFTPAPLSQVSIPGYANMVAINGNYAYVAAGSTGLQVVDVTNRSAPRVVASLATAGNADDIALVGNTAYISDDSAGLQIIDVTHPLAPALLGSFKTPGVAWHTAVSNGVAYIADGSSGVQIVDVENPAAPFALGSLALPGTTEGLDVDGTRNIVVAVGTSGLSTINVANPRAPAQLGSLSYGGSPQNVVLQGNFAFIADSSLSLTSVNVTNPAAPTYGASTDPNLGGELYNITLQGTFALGGAINFINTGVTITDISSAPALNPRSILYFLSGTSAGFRQFDKATGIAADGSYVYLTTDQTNGTAQRPRNGTTADTRLYIGQYAPISDPYGIPPTAAITMPANGTQVIRGSTVQITVTATDDVAVAAVNILINGQIVFTGTAAPYQFSYTVPANATSVTIGAQAVDFGFNIGTAQNVAITAIADPLTTAQGAVTDTMGNPISGATVTCQGLTGTTASDGTFSISSVPTIAGSIQCTASATVNSLPASGASASFAPVRAGVTNVGTIVASALGSRGRDFWLSYPSAAFQTSTVQLFILTDTSANYVVSNASVGLNVTGMATSNAPAIVAIPNSLAITSNETVQSLGIHVTSDADVTVFFFYPTNDTADTYLAVPTPALGTNYYAVSYQDNIGYPSQASVTASQDSTHITVTGACGSTGTPLTATLNQGQTYEIQCTNDVTGTQIASDKPVSVVAQNSCDDIPTNASACDVIAEMMFPVGRLWGTEIYSAPLPGTGVDFYRIIASQNGTVVTLTEGTGSPQTINLSQGQFMELSFKAGAHYTSNNPILVMQYAASNSGNGGTGDPFSMQMVPLTNYAQSFRFYAPPNAGWTSYATIIAPNAGVASVQLNGAAVTGFKALPGGTYQYAVVPVTDGQNVVTAGQSITVYSIGFQGFGSYGAPTRF